MIRRPDERTVTENPNLRGGNLCVAMENLMTLEEFKSMGRLFAVNTIPPTGSIGYHPHIGESEAYYILQGEAMYDDNGVKSIVRKGDVTFCPSGEGHGIENISDEDLVFISLIIFDEKR